MSEPLEPASLLLLHQRLLDGDRLASESLVGALLAMLREELTRKFPHTDEHLVADGVIDALLDYAAQPQQFDPGQGVPLDRFLVIAAWRNVSNLLRSEQRRKNREQQAGSKKKQMDVALDPLAGNIRQEELRQLDQRKAAMLDALTKPQDKEILALLLEGVKDTPSFARILGITHLPLDQQQKEVKRHKDRIRKFLRRKGL